MAEVIGLKKLRDAQWSGMRFGGSVCLVSGFWASLMVLVVVAGLTIPQTARAQPSLKETEDYIEYVLEKVAARSGREVSRYRVSIRQDEGHIAIERAKSSGNSWSYDFHLSDIGVIRASNKDGLWKSGGGCDGIKAYLECRRQGCVTRQFHPYQDQTGLANTDPTPNDDVRILFCKADWQEFLRLTRAWNHAAKLRGASGTSFINEVSDMDAIGSAFD